MWLLASYAVRPGAPGPGHRPAAARGRAVATRAAACAAMFASAPTRRRCRRYRLAGFTLHPQMHLTGYGRPQRAAGRRARPRGHRRRHRPDGLARPAAPRRRARPRPRAAARRCTGCWSPTTRTGSGYVYVAPAGGAGAAGRHQPATAAAAALGGAAVGPARRAGRRSRTSPPANEWAVDVGLAARLSVLDPRLPRPARHATADAVPATTARCCEPLRAAWKTVGMTTVDLPLLPLGRGTDRSSERGVECPGDLPAASDPDLVGARPGGQGRAGRAGVRARATTTSATR